IGKVTNVIGAVGGGQWAVRTVLNDVELVHLGAGQINWLRSATREDKSGRSYWPLITAHWPPTTDFLLVSAGRSEVHIEGIAREADRHRIIRRDIKGRHARRVDPLYSYLLRSNRQILILDLPHYIRTDVLVRLLEVGPIHERDVTKVVLKTVIRHHRGGHFKAGHHHQHDREKSHQRFYGSHSPKLRRRPAA